MLHAVQNEYKVTHISSASGLGHEFVYAILEDSKGCIWFGTQNGLCKYDGKGYRTYRRLPHDSTSLSNNAVAHLLEDRDGNIWAACGDGSLNCLDRYTGKVRRYFSASDTMEHTEIFCMYLDTQGTIWIGAQNGLYRYDALGDMFVRCIFKKDELHLNSDVPISYIGQSASGAYWLTMGFKLAVRFYPREEKYEMYRLSGALNESSEISSLLDENFAAIRRDAYTCLGIINKTLVFEAHTGITFERSELPGERFFRSMNLSYNYAEMPTGDEFWIVVHRLTSNMRGVYRIRAQNPNEPELIVRDNIHTFLRDSQGICWIGGERGVYKATPLYKRFITYEHNITDKTSLSHPRIRSVHLDREGDLWVGADYGLNRLESGAQGWRRYGLTPQNIRGLANPTVNVIFERQNGTLLFGSNFGLFTYRRDQDSFVLEFGAPFFESPARVWSICRDSSGNLWVGTLDQGIWIYDSANTLRQRLLNIPGDSGSLSNNRVWSLHTDTQGNVWAGTRRGLNRWLPSEQRFERITHRTGDTSGICGNDIWAIHEDARGNLWFTAYGSGVSRLAPGSEKFTSLTYGDPLPSDGVYGALSDSDGNIWIASNAGLSLYNPLLDSLMHTYDGGDGLQKGSFSYKAFFKAPDGELFFGGNNGLSRFYPQRIKRNRQPPRMLITAFSVNDSLALHEIADGANISLNYDQNDLSFEFAALGYVNPSKNKCQYMLEGLDDSWKSAHGRRFASYPNLPPGEYVFRVRGANSDNVWSASEAWAGIVIEPPLWQTAWFRIAAVSMLAALAIGVFWLRLRFLRRRHALERQTLESQLQALRAQMNPHFIFNSLTSLHGLLVDEEHDSATDYLAGFARLTRMALEFSRRSFIWLHEELDFLNLYLRLESVRFQGRIDYNVDVDESLETNAIRVPPMMIQPYVENAIHHGLLPKPGRGSLRLTFRLSGDYLICVVEDNGIGRKRALEFRERKGFKHKSLSTQVHREHLRLLNRQRFEAELSIEDLNDARGLPCGTRVTLSIAVQSSEDSKHITQHRE